jgi:hypothetical protein
MRAQCDQADKALALDKRYAAAQAVKAQGLYFSRRYEEAYVLSRTLLEGAPEGPFGTMLLWKRAIEAGRLFGLVHDGAWFHLSRPIDLRKAEKALATGLMRALF